VSAGSAYWNRVAGARTLRRRCLQSALAAGFAAGALGLFGCSDDDGNPPAARQDKSGLLLKPEDTSARALRGGVFHYSTFADPPGFDGLSSLNALASIQNDYAYQRLVQASKVFNNAKKDKMDGSVDPYAAESWEQSADGLQLTMKLRPNNGLDPRPPTNGRVLDSQDVLFAYNRFKATGRARATLVNGLGQDGPVLSVEAPDSRTVTFKLAYPSVSLLPLLGDWFYLALHPREADGGFDPKTTMRGSGPWMLEDYRPSVSLSYKRNPNFYRSDLPYMDGIDLPIIADYSVALAELTAGNLHLYFPTQEDILATKTSAPSLNLFQYYNYPSLINIVFFSLKTGSIWRDERLRQALSLLLDRDLMLNTQWNLDKFAAAGLPTTARWHTLFPAGFEPTWLDPKSREFGANARNLAYDPAEAKKLVQASGKGPVVEADWHVIAGFEFGPGYRPMAELLSGAWQAGGDFKFRTVSHDYTTEFAPRFNLYPQGGRTFDGVALMGAINIGNEDLFLRNYFLPGSVASKFELDYPGDTQWESMVKAQRSEFDAQKRLTILQDLQRLHAARMYTMPNPGSALGFGLVHPAVQNVLVYVSRFFDSYASSEALHYWLDPSRN
jgi:peptide/nickel transport system substrate-binding protein